MKVKEEITIKIKVKWGSEFQREVGKKGIEVMLRAWKMSLQENNKGTEIVIEQETK